MLRCLAFLVGVLLAASAITDARAQSFPSRAVRFIVPFGPGSGADITARLLGDQLANRWGQPVVVENRPGGDGLVAINAFISADDEHTILYVPVALFAVHPYRHQKLSYDADRDLQPIANVTALVLSVAAPASFKTDTLKSLIARIRAEPGVHNAAAAPGAAEFLMSGFLKAENLDMAKVPYRDIVQAPRDLAEGRIQFLMSSLTIVQPLAAGNRVSILAVTSRARAAGAPDVPTVREAGYPGLEFESIAGFFGRRGMSPETRQRIAADVRAVVEGDPTIRTKLEATGQMLDLRGPAEFAAGIKELRGKLDSIAKLLGAKTAP